MSGGAKSVKGVQKNEKKREDNITKTSGGGHGSASEPVKSRRHSLLEIIGFFVGVAGLIAAGITIFYDHDIRRQVLEEKSYLDTQEKNIANIVSNVSTGYLPDWPNYGKYLADLTSHTESGDKLEVQVDTLGYLSFSDPVSFDAYFNALIEAQTKKKIKIRILTLDETTALAAKIEQFGPGKDDDLAKIMKQFPERITAYADNHHNLIDHTRFGQKYRAGRYRSDSNLTPEDRNDFYDALMFVEDDYCLTLNQHGITINVTNDTTLIDGPFIWLRHNRVLEEMILAYPRFGGLIKGYAFRTRDSHLMEIYETQFERKLGNRTISRGSHLFPDAIKRTAQRAHDKQTAGT